MAHRIVSSLLVLIAASAVGCSGGTPAPADEGSVAATPATAPSKSVDPMEMQPPPLPSKSDSGGLSEDQKAQMEIALRRGGEKAANCATVVADAPKGEGEVKVTFDGKKGRATDVSVGAPWAGTPAEACIKRAFIGEIVVPFDGELEVPYTVRIGAKDAPADAKGKKGAPAPKDKKK